MYADLNMNRTLINVNALCAADSGLLKQRFLEKSSLQVTSCIALGNLFQNPAPAANPGSSVVCSVSSQHPMSKNASCDL